MAISEGQQRIKERYKSWAWRLASVYGHKRSRPALWGSWHDAISVIVRTHRSPAHLSCLEVVVVKLSTVN